MTRLILDAGAFIGFERRTERVMALFKIAAETRSQLVTTSPIVGQVWRKGSRQAELARLLRAVDVRVVTEDSAREAGVLLGTTRTTDVVDALLANLCISTDVLITSDPIDLKVLTDSNRSRPTIIHV